MNIEEYYRRYGIKTETTLSQPDFIKAAGFPLPYNTMMAYFPHDELSFGPSIAWPPLANCERDISVDSQKFPTFKEGARAVSFNLDNAVKEYHGKHRRFTRLRNLTTAAKTQSVVIIENYAPLTKPIAYQKSWSRLHRSSLNYFLDVFTDIPKQLGELPGHVMFVPLETPSKAFTKSDFDRVTTNADKLLLETFDTSEALLQGYLYQFLTHAKTWMEDETGEAMAAIAELKDNPWTRLPKAMADRIWLLPISGDSLAVVSLERLVKIVAEKGINTFIRFTNAVFEENTTLDINDEDEEIVFGKDGRPVTMKEYELQQQGVVGLDAGKDIKSVEQAMLVKSIQAEAGKGGLSPREVNYLVGQAGKVAHLKAPDGKTSLVDFAKITEEDTRIDVPAPRPIHPLAETADYQRSRNVDMISQYNDKLLQKDIVRTLLSFQKSGVIVTDFDYELRKDASGAKHYYNVGLSKAGAKASKFHFDFPVVTDEGRFMLNGTEVFYTPQRSDMPIRKVKPTQVKLTSYDGSTFITRGRLKKFNYEDWVLGQLTALSNANEIEVRNRNVADYENDYPRTYTLLGSQYERLKRGDVEFYFNPAKREERYGKDVVTRLEKNGQIVVGTKGKQLLTMDSDEIIYLNTDKGQEALGVFDVVFGLDISKRTTDAAEVRIFSKYVPIGLVLGQRIGFDNIIKTLKLQPRVYVTGERGQTLGEDEYKVEFADKTYVFSQLDRQATLILNSFNIVKKLIKQYNVGDFNKPDVYHSVLEEMGLGLRYTLEVDAMYDLFLDPITVDLLKEMGEPEDLTGLYFRSAELLASGQSPHEVDPEFMRCRHYERFSGFVYKAMSDAVRVQRSRPAGSKAPISIDPKLVIMQVTKDSSKNMVETSNVMRNIREKGFISYAGEGGRTAQTMTPELRIFHPNELGHTSVDNTADSGKVALNASRPHDPLYSNLRGVSYRYNKEEHNEAQLFTTTALAVPGVDRDELKRLNFVSTQYDSVYPTNGYMPMPLHTPMEYELPHMTDKEFAQTAKEDGKVLSVGEHGMKVLYKSGVEKDILLGRMFGRVAGTVIPHEVVTDLKPGQRFSYGDALSWNEAYFERDRYDKSMLAYKSAHIIPMVFVECVDTFEDSTAFWEGVGAHYKAAVTKEQYLHIHKDVQLESFLKVGAEIHDGDPICVQIPPHLQSDDPIASDVIENLKQLGKDVPKAKAEGVLERIEVFYYCQKEDMHPSLRTLANASDRYRKTLVDKHGQSNLSDNGMVTSPVNFGGTKIEPNHVMIKLYITKRDIPLVSGSKTVVAANLKNTISQSFPDRIKMVDCNEWAEGYFSYNGQNNRIVLSAIEQGLGNRGLIVTGKNAAKLYRGEKL